MKAPKKVPKDKLPTDKSFYEAVIASLPDEDLKNRIREQAAPILEMTDNFPPHVPTMWGKKKMWVSHKQRWLGFEMIHKEVHEWIKQGSLEYRKWIIEHIAENEVIIKSLGEGHVPEMSEEEMKWRSDVGKDPLRKKYPLPKKDNVLPGFNLEGEATAPFENYWQSFYREYLYKHDMVWCRKLSDLMSLPKLAPRDIVAPVEALPGAAEPEEPEEESEEEEASPPSRRRTRALPSPKSPKRKKTNKIQMDDHDEEDDE
eukprot:gene9129-10818_t